MIKNIILKTKNNPLFVNGLLFFIFINSANLLNYFYHILLAKYFNIDQYGLYNSINSLIGIFSFPTSIIGILAGSFFLKHFKKEEKYFYSFSAIYLIFTLLLSLLITALFLINSVLIYSNDLANVYTISNILIKVILIYILFLIVPLQQVCSDYKGAGFSQSLPSYIKFLLLIIIFYIPVKDINIVLFSINISFFISILFILLYYKKNISIKLFIRNLFSKIFFTKKFINYYRSTIPIISSSMLISLIVSFDIPLVRFLYGENFSGIYSASALIAKITFFLTSFFNIILFLESLKNNSLKRLFYFLIVNIILFLPLIIIFYFFNNEIIFFTFGEDYLPAADYLLKLCVIYFLISINNFILFDLIGLNKSFYINFLFFPYIVFILMLYVSKVTFYGFLNFFLIFCILKFLYLFYLRVIR